MAPKVSQGRRIDEWSAMVVGNNQAVRATSAEIEAIVRRAFGSSANLERAEPLSGGQINDVRLVALATGERHILRIAPSDVTAAAGPSWFTAYGLRREAAVIAAAESVREFLPVTITHDFDRTVIDRDWVVQEVMPGVPLSEVDKRLDPDTRDDIWAQLGAFTRRLHDVTGSFFGPPVYGPQCARWSELLQTDVGGLLDDAERFGYNRAPFARLAQIVEEKTPLLDEVTKPRLIHSDLCRPHVFVEQQQGRWRIVGTIDLEFGRFADPLSEPLISGFEWGNTPPPMRPAFMRSYLPGRESEADRQRIRIYVALSVAWFAPLLAMKREPVDGLLDRLAQALERC